MKEVAGRVAFITGGASGMGLAMARSFSAAGMNVVIADIEQAALDAVSEEFRASNAEVMTLKVDVARREAMEQAADDVVERFGKVHVLVNNAGVGLTGELASATYKDWDWVLGVNLDGVANGLQAFLPKMRAHGEGAHIVNTASMAGHLPVPGLGIYNATKYAVVAISETLATELEGQNIGVSVLCPGVVRTNIFESDRNRPSELANKIGGSAVANTLQLDDAAAEARLAEIMNNALDPALVGEMVLHAIQENQLYIFTHPDFQTPVRERAARIDAAFDYWRDYRGLSGE